MEIINKTTDFRNWDVFLVKGNEDTIEKYFNSQYPNQGVSILEHLNNRGTFEVTILPKNIMKKLKVVISYKDQTYTQVFELEEDELVEDVIEEVQEEWLEEYQNEIGEIEDGQYDIQYELV